MKEFERSKLLLGESGIQKLNQSKVAIFGLGGVGGYVAEALARSGVGAFILVDDDKICLTNINRQLIATHKTVGKYKTDVMKDRILEINPKAKVIVHRCFFLPGTEEKIDLTDVTYIADAVDTVTAKIELVLQGKELGIPVISCMGTGNKLNPAQLEVADIYKTSICPLAKVMRRELRKRNISGLKVVYSREEPIRPVEDGMTACRNHCVCPPGTQRKCTDRRDIPGSVAFVPPVAGMIMAGEIIKDILLRSEEKETRECPIR